MTPLATSIGSTITNVVDAAGNFFSQLSALNFWSLLLGLALYAIYLLLRSRALFNAVRAAYPGVRGPVARRVGRLHGRLRRSTPCSRSAAATSPSCS